MRNVSQTSLLAQEVEFEEQKDPEETKIELDKQKRTIVMQGELETIL